MRLAGKTAIVTGAGAGQGAAVAASYAREGAAVVLADLDDEGGRRTASSIRDAGGSCEFLQGDIAEEETWRRLVSLAHQLGDGVDVVYHNAALFSPGDTSAAEIDLDLWDEVMRVNVRSIVVGSRATVDEMRRRGGGSIIAVASIRAHLGTTRPQDAYAASKGAVVALCRSMAVHLASDQIRVNVISPGTIMTAMAPIADEAAAAERLARYPLARFGTVDDVTGAALYLASDESRWTTGTELPVDGGTSVFYV